MINLMIDLVSLRGKVLRHCTVTLGALYHCYRHCSVSVFIMEPARRAGPEVTNHVEPVASLKLPKPVPFSFPPELCYVHVIIPLQLRTTLGQERSPLTQLVFKLVVLVGIRDQR